MQQIDANINNSCVYNNKQCHSKSNHKEPADTIKTIYKDVFHKEIKNIEQELHEAEIKRITFETQFAERFTLNLAVIPFELLVIASTIALTIFFPPVGAPLLACEVAYMIARGVVMYKMYKEVQNKRMEFDNQEKLIKENLKATKKRLDLL